MATTVKQARAWMDTVPSALELPNGLPTDLADIKEAFDFDDIKNWVSLSGALKEIKKDSAKLTLTGKIGGVAATVRLLVDGELKDNALIRGVAVELPCDQGLLKSLVELGGTGLKLVFEVWSVGANRKPWVVLTMRATVKLDGNPDLTVIGALTLKQKASKVKLLARPPKGKTVALSALVSKIAGADAKLPEALPTVNGIDIRLEQTDKGVRFLMHEYGGAAGTAAWLLASLPPSGEPKKRTFVVSVKTPLGSKAKLSDIDLLRGQIPVDLDVQLGAQFVYTSRKLTKAQIVSLNKLVGKGPLPEGSDLPEGLLLAASVQIGGQVYRRVLRRPPPKLAAIEAAGPAAATAEPADLAATGPEPAHDPAAADDLVPADDPRYHLGLAPAAALDGDALLLESADTGDEADIGATATIAIDRALGPLHLRQVKLRLLPQSNDKPTRLIVGLDASLVAAGFSLETTGFGLEVDLGKQPSVRVVLAGLGVAYSRDPLHVLGALVSHPPDDRYEYGYDGLLMVKTSRYGLMAVGSYARIKARDGHPAYTSLFIFGALEGKIGGPPPIVFTGLCLGFGFNSRVNLPELDEVTKFPFVRALGHMKDVLGIEPGKPVSPTGVLEKVTGGPKAAVVPANGQMWLAAGLSFSVAEILDASGLLIVQFGDDLVVALMGTISADFPARSAGSSQAPSVAHLELGFRALYEHSKRRFALDAALSDNSWIVYKDCKLTGSAALYVWFPGSKYEGDFVATIGGYHPAFKRPAHYPDMPRIGLSWSVSRAISVKGELYVAVTPAVGMVGGRLEVNYEAGGLRAWLIAYFNAMVWWAPLYFRAEIGITIGASYTADCWLFSVTVRAEVGATLNVWGPPAGGHVRVKVGPFSVGIGFGEPEVTSRPALKWKEFRAKQLPKTVLTVAALDGLLVDPVKVRITKEGTWVVATDGFSFVTRAVLPATAVSYNGKAVQLTDTPVIGGENRTRTKTLSVKPMQYKGSASAVATHTVTVTQNRRDGSPDFDLPVSADEWPATVQYSAVPQALWGAQDTLSPLDATAQPTEVYATGLEVLMPPPTLAGSKADSSIDAIKITLWTGTMNPLKHATSQRTAPGDPGGTREMARKNVAAQLAAYGLLEVAP